MGSSPTVDTIHSSWYGYRQEYIAVAEKMIKSPRNIKYTKYQKNYTHSRGTPAKRHTAVNFGTYGLQCNEPTLLSLKQLETCRRTLRRVIARRAPI